MNAFAMTFMVLNVMFFIAIIYLFIRNERVFKFRMRNNDLVFDWASRHITEIATGKERSPYDWFMKDMPSYDAMVYSFKPLKLENWISQDKLEKLLNS